MLDNVASSGPGRLRRVRSKIQSYRGVPPLVVIAGSTYEISGHFPHLGPTGFNSRFTSIYPITANRQVVLPCSRDSERGEKGICWRGSRCRGEDASAAKTPPITHECYCTSRAAYFEWRRLETKPFESWKIAFPGGQSSRLVRNEARASQ